MLWPEVPQLGAQTQRSMGSVPWNSRTQEVPVLSSKPEAH